MKTPRLLYDDSGDEKGIIFEIGSGHLNSLLEKGDEKTLFLEYDDFSEAVLQILPVLNKKFPNHKRNSLELFNTVDVKNMHSINLGDVKIPLNKNIEIKTFFTGADVIKEFSLPILDFIFCVNAYLKEWKVFYVKRSVNGELPQKFTGLFQEEFKEKKVTV